MNKQFMVVAAIAMMVSGSAFAGNCGNDKDNGKAKGCQEPNPTNTPTSNGYGYGGNANATGGNAYSAGGNASVWGSGNSSISGVVLSGGQGGQGGQGGAGGSATGGTANATGVNVSGLGNKVLSPSATIEKGAVSNTYNPTNINTYSPTNTNTNTNNVDNRNTNTNLNTLSNRQDQSQQQKQGQMQGQKQSVDNSGNSSSSSSSGANGNGVNNGNNNGNIAAGAVQNSQSAVGSGNATTVSYNQDVGASSAFAPALTSGEDTCMGSSSVGGSGVGFGFSVGSTWTDLNCQRLKNARQMYNFGQTTIAIKMMCADAEVKKAAEAAGSTICATPAKAASKSSKAVYSLVSMPDAEQGSVCDRTDDEFIRARNNCN